MGSYTQGRSVIHFGGLIARSRLEKPDVVTEANIRNLNVSFIITGWGRVRVELG